ncbi:MAG: tRNA (guanosine(37)-N1)-methyltransferase TrmD [Leptospirales bacterium]|nr:tRNA (guanosine(37)-N1)-methyltransferase TrmD [Leptospirales bacterium]
MIFQVLTQFPERYRSYLESGLPARAHSRRLFEIYPVQLRDFADEGRKGRIDDSPYGGGPGMVVQIGPVHRALQSLVHRLPVVLLTPGGEALTQRRVRSFSTLSGLTLICGYYEGVDQRIADKYSDYQISIGNFILGSGDLAALCLIEAVTRLLPGYMGSAESQAEESHEEDTLEYPQYTRPAEYDGMNAPAVLLEGNHQRIREWRREQSRILTELRKANNVRE